MEKQYQTLIKNTLYIQNRTAIVPQIAIVLGSGLGAFADIIKTEAVIDYKELEDFPHSTVSGHNGRFVFGTLENIPVVVMQGRVHYYEGYSMSEVVSPIRIMGMLGAKKLLLTNSAGGINFGFSVGDFMMITGHISSFVPSPLIGKNIPQLGERFPDMTELYSKRINKIIESEAEKLGIKIKKGVYLQVSGPAYETPEEINMYRAFGADAVGMSTACEAVAAKHMGLEVCGISCITNMASGMNDSILSHNDVKTAANKASADFKSLVKNIILNI